LGDGPGLPVEVHVHRVLDGDSFGSGRTLR
jgi:hypothetical protein